MHNALAEVPELIKLVQIGVRDFCESEWEYIQQSNNRVVTYFDKKIKELQYEGHNWSVITQQIIDNLPSKVFISFDIDGLNRTLCPHTGMPVPGGFEAEQMFFLFKKILDSGRKIIGFDLCETGVSSNEWDENVGARVLFKLCNLTVASN